MAWPDRVPNRAHLLALLQLWQRRDCRHEALGVARDEVIRVVWDTLLQQTKAMASASMTAAAAAAGTAAAAKRWHRQNCRHEALGVARNEVVEVVWDTLLQQAAAPASATRGLIAAKP